MSEKKGFEATRIHDITELANVNRGTFYFTLQINICY
ncbi:TetR family transcriptional regulator [Paenibacillus protaetiae]|uniref:TetR/AcrR family transcriptional regulator n=1 Tax=Paenibacillus protaetiae TaxID=2509456 RepID=A0A4P6EZ75_9BACL|nr:TetR/AcrR family transcriptional regulator [Paenibacillus protaetiae]